MLFINMNWPDPPSQNPRTKEDLIKQVEKIRIKDASKIQVYISDSKEQETRNGSSIMHVYTTRSGYKRPIGDEIVKINLLIWEYLNRIDSPVKIGAVEVNEKVGWIMDNYKVAIINEEQYNDLKQMKSEDAIRHVQVYNRSPGLRRTSCIEGICRDEKGNEYRRLRKDIQLQLPDSWIIDYMYADDRLSNLYWFVAINNNESVDELRNGAIYDFNSKNRSIKMSYIGIYDTAQHKVLQTISVQEVWDQVKKKVIQKDNESLLSYEVMKKQVRFDIESRSGIARVYGSRDFKLEIENNEQTGFYIDFKG